MVVKRIVADLKMIDPDATRAFYMDVFGLDLIMDQGWIMTFRSDFACSPQLNAATEGGSGTELPAVSIEVDDVEFIHERVKEAGASIVYDLTDEPWGVRRFFVQDPSGNVLNVLQHLGTSMAV